MEHNRGIPGPLSSPDTNLTQTQGRGRDRMPGLKLSCKKVSVGKAPDRPKKSVVKIQVQVGKNKVP